MIREAQKVLETIIEAGYEAYFVGGFVRDHMLGIESGDVDITTNARPNEIIALFSKVIPTGIDHGTVTVIEHGHSFEVTTYRSDGTYTNKRRPDEVVFGDRVQEDLSRRDFTINALIMDELGEVFDYTEGLKDLMLHKIRTIGDPHRRFQEDALRMLRAIRFQSKLGFEIEKSTLDAIYEHKDLLEHVSKERIKNELTFMFKGRHLQKALKTLNDIRFPQFNFELRASNELTILENFTQLAIEEDLDLQKWKFTRFEQQFIRQTRRFIDEAIDEYAIYKHEQLTHKINVFNFLTGNDIYEYCMKIKHNLPIHYRQELAVTGHDLKELGYKGKMLGELLEEMEKAVVYRLIVNDKDALLDYIRRPQHDRNQIIASRSRSNDSCENK